MFSLNCSGHWEVLGQEGLGHVHKHRLLCLCFISSHLVVKHMQRTVKFNSLPTEMLGFSIICIAEMPGHMKWISTNSWCGYRSVVRCWFQKLGQDGHSWCQKTLKPTWRSFLFGNRSVPSFPTEKDGWSPWFCAFLAAVNFSQCGTSHGQEVFPDVCFFFSSSYPLGPCASFHPVWILCLFILWVKPVLRLVSGQLLAKGLLVLFTSFIIPHQNHSSLHLSLVYTYLWMVPRI